MKRRSLMILTLAAALALPLAAEASPPVAYTPGMVKAALAAGKTVFLDFHATWCTTCAAQQRVIDKLRAGDPGYDKAIDFVVVDWDTYKDAAITRRMKVGHRATLIALKGDKVLGRLDWETGAGKIKQLLDTARSAAS